MGRCRSQRELGQLILKRFLLFVLLLERLATSGTLPPDVPLMFRLDSPIKSSKEVRRMLPCRVSSMYWDDGAATSVRNIRSQTARWQADQGYSRGTHATSELKEC